MADAPDYIRINVLDANRIFCRVSDYKGFPRWKHYDANYYSELGEEAPPLEISVLYLNNDWVVVNTPNNEFLETSEELLPVLRSNEGLTDSLPSSYFTNYCSSITSIQVNGAGVSNINGLYLNYDDPNRLVMGKKYSVFKKSPSSIFKIELDITRDNLYKTYKWTIYGSPTPYAGAPAYTNTSFSDLGEDLTLISCPPGQGWEAFPGANSGSIPTLTFNLRAP